MKKTLSSILEKTQSLVGSSWVKVLVITMVLTAPMMPGTVSVPMVSPGQVQAQGAMPDGDAAVTEFSNLFRRVRTFAGILLLIGTVTAGILFMVGKQAMAMAVFLGSVIVFGGAFVVGLVNSAFSKT